jgi:alkanesulfonate monooxygenase SsuD/methylene tetrahydromethanopterin reductase-like flavin-dependent oxidoreductase (luciferase family)
VRIGFKTSPQGVEWSTLDATWALAGSLDVFESAWMNDHLSDVSYDRHGPSFEALTAIATLAHHVPGRWLGHAVLANTFRHPGVLAKAATVLDHATGGRFILGLGAGWHLGEHESLGIPLPPIGERIDRLESAVGVIRALFADEAARPPGVTRPDRFYPLDRATNEPPPVRAAGPPIYLGGQRPRGIALAARAADGWLLPGVNAGDSAYLSARREELLRALEAAGRPSDDFAIVGQVNVGPSAQDRRRAVDEALELVRVGATELIVGIAASRGPDELAVVAREVGEPLREALG